jgi:phage terminase large subunit-like protein
VPRKSRGGPTSTSRNPYPLEDPTTRYAWDVVNGQLVAGDLAIRACQRHLDDIEYGSRRGLFWRPDFAKAALDFFPDVLRVTAGAAEGKPFYLPSYTTFVVGSLFGWVRADGRLRFRRAWVEAGKGQIKALAVDTPIATPTGWTTMGDLRDGDEVLEDIEHTCRVIRAHPVHHGRPCYRVTFNGGDAIVADTDHLWRIETATQDGGFVQTTAEIASALSAGIGVRIGRRWIVSCEPAPSVRVRCITVDSPSQMFLAGRSLVPTHNSPLAAACGLYILGFRGIARSEAYAIAKDRNQANVLFQDAVAMANAPIADRDDGASLVSTGVLLPRGTGEMTWMLEHPSSMSKFRALAGDEKVSGPRPSFVAADEIHEWRNDGPLRIWQSAGAKMPGDFLLWMSTNTPAADQLVGTEYSSQYQRILRGEIDDDAAFAYIARVDEQDDPLNDESCWVKAMPCLDLTFPRENVRFEVQSARHSMGTLLNVKRLYFGIPVGASEYWIDIDAWERVQGHVDEEAMKGLPCWLGMDLSEKNDLTALAAMWRDADGHYYLTVRYWKPEEGLAAKAVQDNAKYVEWAAEGLLKTTPGKSIDYDFVAKEVQTLCAEQNVEAMSFDPAHITEFRKACDRLGFETWIWQPGEPPGRGLKMIVHSQGVAGMHSKKMLWMPRSMGQFEDLILTEKITIQDSQLTKWCAGNAAVKADEHGNRYLIKKHRRGRIDGVVAAPMCAGVALSDLGAVEEMEFQMLFIGGNKAPPQPRGFA